MPTIITQERPDTTDASVMINELEAHLSQFYPAVSRHGFSVEKLLAEDVPFFLLREHGTAAACGGIKLFGTVYGELRVRQRISMPNSAKEVRPW